MNTWSPCVDSFIIHLLNYRRPSTVLDRDTQSHPSGCSHSRKLGFQSACMLGAQRWVGEGWEQSGCTGEDSGCDQSSSKREAEGASGRYSPESSCRSTKAEGPDSVVLLRDVAGKINRSSARMSHSQLFKWISALQRREGTGGFRHRMCSDLPFPTSSQQPARQEPGRPVRRVSC